MNLIKNCWLNILCCMILLLGLIIFVLSLISPRQDIKKRGFIPCTEHMATELLSCEDKGYYFCILSGIMQGSWCNLNVVAEGAKLWFKGKQKTPWDNYIFTPELPHPDEDEKLKQEFYQHNPNMQHDLLKLEYHRNQLDNKLNQIKEQQNATK